MIVVITAQTMCTAWLPALEGNGCLEVLVQHWLRGCQTHVVPCIRGGMMKLIEGQALHAVIWKEALWRDKNERQGCHVVSKFSW